MEIYMARSSLNVGDIVLSLCWAQLKAILVIFKARRGAIGEIVYLSVRQGLKRKTFDCEGRRHILQNISSSNGSCELRCRRSVSFGDSATPAEPRECSYDDNDLTTDATARASGRLSSCGTRRACAFLRVRAVRARSPARHIEPGPAFPSPIANSPSFGARERRVFATAPVGSVACSEKFAPTKPCVRDLRP